MGISVAQLVSMRVESDVLSCCGVKAMRPSHSVRQLPSYVRWYYMQLGMGACRLGRPRWRAVVRGGGVVECAQTSTLLLAFGFDAGDILRIEYEMSLISDVVLYLCIIVLDDIFQCFVQRVHFFLLDSTLFVQCATVAYALFNASIIEVFLKSAR